MRPDQLIDHPEGGRFQEVFRSTQPIIRNDGRSRCALTHIYFSLNSGEVSCFHRVEADEVWNLYQGTGVRLYLWDGGEEAPIQVELSALSGCFCHVVPAGYWQAAEPLEGPVLVGCSVAPGFEFADFQLLAQGEVLSSMLLQVAPELIRFLAGTG